VQTLTFKTLYVLVFIAHGRRELVHVNVTAHPTAGWVWWQVIQATPWGNRATCSMITMPGMAATSAGGHNGSVSTPSPHPSRALARTPSSKDSSGRYAENVWTI
jgi:hypothetical protein